MSNVSLPNRPLRELHLFAGAGGGILGGILLGHTCVCAVEIEPYCRKVLLQRQRDGILPRFPIWDDVRTFDGKPWRGLVDVVCAGIPCQRVSAAGSGGGFIDQDYYTATINTIRDSEPGIVFLENSPLLCSRGLGCVLWDLAAMGFDARWGVLSAGELGAWHSRPRIWILAFNPLRFGIKGSRERPSSSKAGPWGAISEKHLREVLESPTTDQGSIKPLLSGDEYGFPDWMDRVKATGNAQVPQVVELAWRTLT